MKYVEDFIKYSLNVYYLTLYEKTYRFYYPTDLVVTIHIAKTIIRNLTMITKLSLQMLGSSSIFCGVR